MFALEQWLSIQPNRAHACYVPYFWLHGSSLTVRMHALSTRLLASFPIRLFGASSVGGRRRCDSANKDYKERCTVELCRDCIFHDWQFFAAPVSRVFA